MIGAVLNADSRLPSLPRFSKWIGPLLSLPHREREHWQTALPWGSLGAADPCLSHLAAGAAWDMHLELTLLEEE